MGEAGLIVKVKNFPYIANVKRRYDLPVVLRKASQLCIIDVTACKTADPDCVVCGSYGSSIGLC